jgi:hypothetical protein
MSIMLASRCEQHRFGSKNLHILLGDGRDFKSLTTTNVCERDRHLRPDDREEQDEIFRMTSKVEKQRGAEESDPRGPDDDWLDGPAMAQLGA